MFNYSMNMEGCRGIAEALKTNIDTGICEDETLLKARRQAFGTNQYMNLMSPPKNTKCPSQIAIAAIKDGMPLLLLCSVILSFVLDVKENGLEEAMVDQALLVLPTIVITTCCPLIILSCLGAVRRQKEKGVVVTVIRRGNEQKISLNEVVVGDVACLKKGEIVPADGLFINNVSSSVGPHDSFQPFMYGRTKVLKGDCRMLVTAVGKETERSTMMGLLCSDHPQKDLISEAVHKMSSRLEKVLTSFSVIVLLVEVISCVFLNVKCSDADSNDGPKAAVKNTIVEILEKAAKMTERFDKRAYGRMATLCILIFSIRDALPLGILIILAYASRRMATYGVKIRNLQACGTLGSVTTICISDTGDLKMVELWIGLETIEEVSLDFIPLRVLNLLHEGICMLRSLSPIEQVLVCWSKRLLDIDQEELKQNSAIFFEDIDQNLLQTKLIAGSNTEDDEKIFHIHCSGPPKVLLSKCSHYFDRNGGVQTLDEPTREAFNKIIEGIEAHNIHSIAFAFQQVVLEGNEVERFKVQGEGKPETLKLGQSELILVGMIGLKHPYYGHEIQQAIISCRESGTEVKLLLGKDFNIAKEIAIASRIMKTEEEPVDFKVIDASEFRNSSIERRLTMMDEFQIMVNTSPMDTLLVIQCLKQKGEVVALMSSSSRDFPSLKEANVGCLITSMDAKSADDEDCYVEISNMNFACFFDRLDLGRTVIMKVRKFIQLALTSDIAAFMVNFIASLISKRVPLPPLQIVWVSLVIHALQALATSLSEPPLSPSPVINSSSGSQPCVHNIHSKNSRIVPLVTRNMWKNVSLQVLYQGIVFLVLHLKGEALMHADEKVVKAMILNFNILCQVFALLLMISIMEVEKRKDLKVGDDKRRYGWLIIMIVILCGGLIIITMAIHGESSLDVGQWCACGGLAALSLAVDWIITATNC
ncbi:hypothetical protein Ancab_034885 [Ancistrocladus abbreviatus]